MDPTDCYYGDVVDGLSDADSIDSSDEEGGDDGDGCERLLSYGKYLTEGDKAILLGRRNGTLTSDEHGGQGRGAEEEEEMSFEQQMQNEAAQHVNGVHVTDKTTVARTTTTTDNKHTADMTGNNDAINMKPSTSRTKESENDELLYDPDEDDSNERWIESLRSKSLRLPNNNNNNNGNSNRSIDQSHRRQQQQQQQQQTTSSAGARGPIKVATSDARLSCPCCMALLCLDCQRHQVYKTQYRAMFVSNCRIDYQKKLVHKDKQAIRDRFRRSKRSARATQQDNGDVDVGGSRRRPDQHEPDDAYRSVERVYYSVHCAQCDTAVAVYDHDQVYHFFSVLASH